MLKLSNPMIQEKKVGSNLLLNRAEKCASPKRHTYQARFPKDVGIKSRQKIRAFQVQKLNLLNKQTVCRLPKASRQSIKRHGNEFVTVVHEFSFGFNVHNAMSNSQIYCCNLKT